jgi:hypothetical protein
MIINDELASQPALEREEKTVAIRLSIDHSSSAPGFEVIS